MLLFDSVLALAQALHDYLSDENIMILPPTDQTGLCSSLDFTSWPNGTTLMEYLSKVGQ